MILIKSKIEWTDRTWNPITGCSKVSEGCRNCYADAMFTRFESKWGKFNDVKCHEDKLQKPFRLKKPQKIFVNSMSDLFHEKVPFEFIDKVMAVIALNPKHTFLVLTKRPKRMKLYFDQWYKIAGDFDLTEAMDEVQKKLNPLNDNEIEDSLVYDLHPIIFLRNLWLGVSVEDQKTADERIPILLNIPASVRFLSCEPLLDELNLNKLNTGFPPFNCLTGGFHPISNKQIHRRIDWVIVGGESGPKARPMHPDWVRSIRDQCQKSNVPFFFKQWGAYYPREQGEWNTYPLEDYDLSDDRMPEFVKVGKTKAGSLLDGEEWKQFPVVERGIV